MATIISAVGGKQRGKNGNTIFRQVKGRTIASEYQPYVRNPNTPAQQHQRTKLTGTSQVLLGFNRVFKAGFDSYRVLPSSHRGSILTHRSAVSKEILSALSEMTISSNQDKDAAFENVAGALAARRVFVDISRAKSTVSPAFVSGTIVEKLANSINIHVDVTNPSADPVEIKRPRIFCPRFTVKPLGGMSVDRGVEQELTASVIIQPEMTHTFQFTFIIMPGIDFTITPSWYQFEGLINNDGIIATPARVLENLIFD